VCEVNKNNIILNNNNVSEPSFIKDIINKNKNKNKKSAIKNNKIHELKQNIINIYKSNLYELLVHAGAKITINDIDLLMKNNIRAILRLISEPSTTPPEKF
jgi:hypothetical protein